MSKMGFFLWITVRAKHKLISVATDFYENGKRLTGKYLEVSFPISATKAIQLFYGENMECLLEGLEAIFRHIGVVPEELWF